MMISINEKNVVVKKRSSHRYCELKDICSEVIKKYYPDSQSCENDMFKHIRFDYYRLINKEDRHYNMKFYSKCIGIAICKPNDPRGFWACRFCKVLSFSPLQFEVDGIIFTPYLV